jgi:hypothetical protein
VLFDIDTPVETIQAYAANYRPSPNDIRVWMPKEQWFSLNDKTKYIWVHYAGSNNPHTERKYIERQKL